jgi:hypothetical protein
MRCNSFLLAALALVLICGCSQPSKPTPAEAYQRALVNADIKTNQDAVKSITDEIAGDDKGAADAEALAKNPPANIADADKAAYIDQRKNEEQMLQDAAADARQRLAEAQKNLDESKNRLKALDNHN